MNKVKRRRHIKPTSKFPYHNYTKCSLLDHIYVLRSNFSFSSTSRYQQMMTLIWKGETTRKLPTRVNIREICLLGSRGLHKHKVVKQGSLKNYYRQSIEVLVGSEQNFPDDDPRRIQIYHISKAYSNIECTYMLVVWRERNHYSPIGMGSHHGWNCCMMIHF